MESAEHELIAAQGEYISFLEERCFSPLLRANLMIDAELEHKGRLMIKIAEAKTKINQEKK